MKKRNHYSQYISGTLEFVNNPLPGVPLIEIYDHCRVLVENHCGVLGYCSEEVQVRVRSGIVCVRGDGLCLKNMCRERLVVTGNVHGVEFRRSC